MEYEFARHSLAQLQPRNITKEIVDEILQNSQQVVSEDGYAVYQSIIKFDESDYLIRVFVNETLKPFKIITVYKISKIDKYYEGEI